MVRTISSDARRAQRFVRVLQFGLGMLTWFAALAAVQAQNITPIEALLVDEGFRIFTEETFDGNGRTCSTCHLPQSNYSISPAEIAELDEEDRALVFASNVPGLEDPALLNDLALFNTKGGRGDHRRAEGDAFRGSMTIAALDLTTLLVGASVPGPLGPQLGWAGDGSPSAGFHHGNHDFDADGSIRAFANGAIAQHHTKRLARIAGIDFRFATDRELNALDAFQRWLGRRPIPSGNSEFDITQLEFEDFRIEQGKRVFLSPQATCNVCHTNGGANFAGAANVNLDTGVESERGRLSEETGVEIPRDEGAPNAPLAPAVLAGDGAFNIQSIIEAPRKKVFFHNGTSVGDIEEATKFYFSESFLESPSNVVLPAAPLLTHCRSVECLNLLTPNALEKLGAFMRSLSAFYALVDCERLLQESIARTKFGASTRVPLQHAVFALRDVRDVLNGAHLFPRPFERFAVRANRLADELQGQADAQPAWQVPGLLEALHVVRTLRAGIATTPEIE